MLDDEFIYGKGRRISVRDRYPHIFRRGKIYVSGTDGCVIAYPFGWLVDGRLWHGIMIGAVCVRPECRGKGIGTRLVQEAIADSRADFGVLWTTIPSFYRRMGWRSKDTGLFGKAKPGNYFVSNRVSAQAVSYYDRSKYANSRVIPAAWATIPIPAEYMLLYAFGDEGYALVGWTGDTAYIYDFIGTPEAYPHLWGTICKLYKNVYVNTHQNDPARSWLADRADLKQQNLAMWLPLMAKSVDYAEWYIPYFERI